MIEAVMNIVIGFSINFFANLVVLPLFGFNVSAGQAFGIGLIFTAIALIRSYALRRLFNHWHRKQHAAQRNFGNTPF